jgi:antitoxin HicB
LRYRIHLEPDDNDTLLVTCPDIPEVATFGDDDADARLHAVDAIVTALQGRINARGDIPAPTEGDGTWIELGALIEAKVELYRLMQAGDVTKAELGRRLQAHGPSVDRLLDLTHDSRLGSIELAYKALGREMHIAHGEAA